MNYITINSAAKKGPFPEFRLRKWLKEGRLPGFYAGNRFYVNYDLLMQMIEGECYQNMGGSTKS